MAKFDVYRLDIGALVVDCQADLLSDLDSRLVVPLVPAEESWGKVSRLNPTIPFSGAPHVLLPQEAATLSVSQLGTRVGSLAEHDLAIGNALDMLISGF
jgi:toxin CcdB